MENGPTLPEPHVVLAELQAHPEYRVCKDQHDPRGWTIRTQEGSDAGVVQDLIVDEHALAVRYLVCSVQPSGRRVLIPTGFVRLGALEHVVYLDFICDRDLERLPEYSGLPLSAKQQLDIEVALTAREPSPPRPLIRRRQETHTGSAA